MQIDKAARWGDLESDEEASSEEEESEDEDEEATVRGDDEASLADGLASVGGVSSLPSGLETPEVIDLRKAKAGGELVCRYLLVSRPSPQPTRHPPFPVCTIVKVCGIFRVSPSFLDPPFSQCPPFLAPLCFSFLAKPLALCEYLARTKGSGHLCFIAESFQPSANCICCIVIKTGSFPSDQCHPEHIRPNMDAAAAAAAPELAMLALSFPLDFSL